MDIRKIRKLIELLEETGIAEIEIKEGEESLRLSRYGQTAPPQHTTYAAQPIQHAPQHVSLPPAHVEPSTPAVLLRTGHEIHSPMVGTLYVSSSPDNPPFVKVGQTVAAGDTLCIIEAMKMFNEIEADSAGVITEILVTNGQPVEYGQLLFVIE